MAVKDERDVKDLPALHNQMGVKALRRDMGQFLCVAHFDHQRETVHFGPISMTPPPLMPTLIIGAAPNEFSRAYFEC